MPDEVIIYGKDSCPYTRAAIDDYQGREIPFRYINVKKDKSELENMLALTRGKRLVPVIVEGGRITIGFGGT